MCLVKTQISTLISNSRARFRRSQPDYQPPKRSQRKTDMATKSFETETLTTDKNTEHDATETAVHDAKVDDDNLSIGSLESEDLSGHSELLFSNK